MLDYQDAEDEIFTVTIGTNEVIEDERGNVAPAYPSSRGLRLTLHCPERHCDATYKGDMGRRDRLEHHRRRAHPQQKVALLA